MLNNWLLVALGGACGAVLRYGVVAATQLLGMTFPVGTLAVNVLGSFLIGILATYWIVRTGGGTQLFFQTGLLGAFTTFSAFSLDTLTLWHSGHEKAAAINVLLNVLLCLLAVAAGMAFGGNLAK